MCISCVQQTVPYYCKFPTLVLYDKNGHVLHQNGVEFHQEFNGHGSRHVTRVFHVSDTFFFILVLKIVLNFCKFPTLVLDDLHTSALHKNWVEFHQEFNGHGPRHVTLYFTCPTRFFHFSIEDFSKLTIKVLKYDPKILG